MQGCKRALGLAVAAALLIAAPARAAVYTVTTTADTPPLQFPCTPTDCSLRQAIEAADAGPGGDQVSVPAGTYALSFGSTSVSNAGGVTISGADAGSTVISAGGLSQVLSIGGEGSATLSGLTVRDGAVTGESGGNIFVGNSARLGLDHVRVTGGSAGFGGGIATSTSAVLAISASLIDNNTASNAGGGIYISDDGLGTAARIQDTTVAFNTAPRGGGIDVQSNNGATDLRALTIAYNQGDGLYLGVPGASVTGSILAANAPFNCGGVALAADGGGNVESGTDCGLAGRQSTDPQLATALTDAGGQTPVLPIAATSPAIDAVSPCLSGADQRDVARPQGAACDAGAFELVPAVQPPPPPAPPAPTPTPTPVPTPEPQKSVVGQVTDGKIFVRKPGTDEFVALDPTKPIPLGSVIDSKQGEIKITALVKKGGKPQSATFYDGVFKLTQTRTTTDLTLSEALAKCGKSAHAAAKKPKSRKLWGSGSGSFRTRGQYSSATVRGTTWLVQDTCEGTLTRVAKGVVSVRDNIRRKTLILRAHKRYLARPRKR